MKGFNFVAIFITLIFSTLILSTIEATAQKKKMIGLEDDKRAKPNTKTYVVATSAVVKEAIKAYRKKKVASGGALGKSVDHQRYALEQYKAGNFQKAVLHSWKARKLAFISLEANGGTIDKAWAMDVEKVSPPLDKKRAKKVKEKHTDLGELENELDHDVKLKTDEDAADANFESVK